MINQTTRSKKFYGVFKEDLVARKPDKSMFEIIGDFNAKTGKRKMILSEIMD